MTLTIKPVASKADFKTFIALPRLLYAGMPGFVAPLDHERRQLLDPDRSGFHTHGEAAYFIAWRGDEAVGRISAQVDHLATGDKLDGLGFFGCLDAIDDRDVVAALLQTAEDWLVARGKLRTRGPFLLSINGESGLLIEGYTELPMLLMPWHPRYLRAHLESQGYELAKILDSYVFDVAGAELRPRLQRLGLDRRRDAYTIRPMRMDHLAEDVEAGRQLFNGSWAGNWGFVPVSKEEMAKLVDGFRQLLKPDYGVFIERGGRLVGFALFLPNVFDISADVGGSPGPFGWLKLAFRGAIGQFTSGRTILFGIARDLMGTVSGSNVALILVDELVRRGASTRFRRVECGWILEDNTPMQMIIEWLGAERIRRFGVFEKSLPAAKTAGEASKQGQGL